METKDILPIIENIIEQSTQKDMAALDHFCHQMIEDAQLPQLSIENFNERLNTCMTANLSTNSIYDAVITAYQTALCDTINNVVETIVEGAETYFCCDNSTYTAEKPSWVEIELLPLNAEDRVRYVIENGKALRAFICDIKKMFSNNSPYSFYCPYKPAPSVKQSSTLEYLLKNAYLRYKLRFLI